MTDAPPAERFQSFAAFYPFYIHEHSNRACRRIHVIGTGLVIVAFAAFVATRNPWWLPAMPLNMRTLTIADAGDFDGCPPSWERQPSQATLMASADTTALGSR